MWIILRLEQLSTHWDSRLDFVKFHILKLQTLISEPEPSLKTSIRNEIVIEMVQNLVCGAHLILTQYRVRLARSERGSADIWILGVFSDPSIFSEPRFSFPEVHFQTLSGNLWCIVMILIKTHRVEQLSTRLRPQIGFSSFLIFRAQTIFSELRFSSPEVEFWTLSENLRWCVIVLTNTYRVEQLPTRLRAQIGFSKNVIFQAQTMISEPAPPLKNRWSRVKAGSKWSHTFASESSGPPCSHGTEPVVSRMSSVLRRNPRVDIRIFGVLAIKLNLISWFPLGLTAILEMLPASGTSLTFTNRLGRALSRLDWS